MGAISDSIADAAVEAGAEICTNATVDRILYEGKVQYICLAWCIVMSCLAWWVDS